VDRTNDTVTFTHFFVLPGGSIAAQADPIPATDVPS
jgi:hypothetical protein